MEAPAKANLYLEVGKPTASGYHRITSVMQTLALADRLTIEHDAHLVFQCSDATLASEENLVVKAAKLLMGRFYPTIGAKITLVKNIPIAAGLGGGSADAAAALVGLNSFWNLNLSDKQLMDLAPELGADVAFCLVGGTALVTGFGETVEPLAPADIGPILIVKPNGALASGAVYDKFDRIKTKSAGGVERILKAIDAGDTGGIISACANDLEPAAVSLLPKIVSIKERALQIGASLCMVSGSGPSMLVKNAADAGLVEVEKVLTEFGRTFLTGPVNHGPLIIGTRCK